MSPPSGRRSGRWRTERAYRGYRRGAGSFAIRSAIAAGPGPGSWRRPSSAPAAARSRAVKCFGRYTPDDRPQLAVDEIPGGIPDPPGRWPAGLVPGGEPADHLTDPLRVPVDGEPPGEVHADVVPGRHHLAVPRRAGVPGRRDIRLRAVHDGQRHRVRPGGPPLRVRQCQVAEQPPVPVLRRPGAVCGAGGPVPQDGDQAGDRLRPVERDEVGGPGAVDERPGRRPVPCGEVFRQVHTRAKKALAAQVPGCRRGAAQAPAGAGGHRVLTGPSSLFTVAAR